MSTFEKGDAVLCLTPGLRKRVLEVIVPELPQTGMRMIERRGVRTDFIAHGELLLIEPARARQLSVVAEAHERSKKQWGDEIPPYMKGVPPEEVLPYLSIQLPDPNAAFDDSLEINEFKGV